MKKYIVALCVLVGIVILSSFCFAGFESGASLAGKWNEYKKKQTGMAGYRESDTAFYTGYVEAIADSGDGILFTLPGDLTVSKLLTLAGKWLDDHPSDLKKPADFLVTQALRAAFPLSDTK